MLWKLSFVLAAALASPVLSAPAPARVPQSQQLNCTPNNQGVDVCCDQFGGCVLRNDLAPGFEDRIVNKRQQLNCKPNNQGVDVCCDQFGGCILRNDLTPNFRDRIANKREPEA